VLCPSCATENRDEAKFCRNCGSGLALSCPNGHPVAPGARFCDECGARIGIPAAPSEPPHDAERAVAPSAERKLVSVLFADLVGFTSFSEGRDAEDVRELLSRYFETSKRLVALYGGTIEKFIGDAVMAVWGTPVAQEDDAERAVRAALELTAAVAALGTECGVPELRARAGVLTGEAAVTLGADSQGMVAGDLVNTASRIQSAAQPGSVLVGEVTRRTTEAAVVYEDAGSHEMKGKSEPVPLWRAIRVVAGRGGAQKSAGLEPPFVGRDREFRLVKELFHASTEESRAHLASIIGIGGIGKSRLAWEFEKYIDGLLDLFLWHRGRCLAYGEGVTYWALAEMVRMRARITEGEEQASAVAKLHAVIEQYVNDPDEREWVEPRLAHLLGLEERKARDAEDLFSAWRLFIERMTESRPVVLIFEDMQWADQSLVDFVDYLMTWSKNHALFVIVLARPEFTEKHPSWGAGRRGSTTLYLEPLSPDAMEALLAGLVPGLPEGLRSQILERAEGVPLYAVETVRMLLHRGLLIQEGAAYRPTGPVEDLLVPETLQALIAARLDALEPAERRLLQDAAVVGKTFTKAALAAMSGSADESVEDLLTALRRKEFLSIQADPRSPEHGQHGFLQDLVRRVAYETLARKDRKARHLAAAAYLEREWGTDHEEVVEVVSSHYLEAYRAAPDADDASEIKARAREALTNAGRRAASLAAHDEARRYFMQGIELSDDPLISAELHERAGDMARTGGRTPEAVEHYESSIELFERAGKTHPAARVSAAYAEALRDLGRIPEAIERMKAAYEVLSVEEPDADLATLAHALGRLEYFRGNMDEAVRHNELALTLAEKLQLPEVFAHALNTKYLILGSWGRPEEALALLQHALQVGRDNDLHDAVSRTLNNIGAQMNERDRHAEEFAAGEQIIELARKVGNRVWELRGMAGQMGSLFHLGRWEEALEMARTVTRDGDPRIVRTAMTELVYVPQILAMRGDVHGAQQWIDEYASMGESEDVQESGAYSIARAWVLFTEGRFDEALEVAGRAYERSRDHLGVRSPQSKEALTAWFAPAFALNLADVIERRLTEMDALLPGEMTPYLVAQRSRLGARLAVLREETAGVESGFRDAISSFRLLDLPLWVGIGLLEHGEWLAMQGRAAEASPRLTEARTLFEGLEARPFLDRLDRLGGAAAKATTG
jgi:predicted ATPase/class 3 adenylate cyclase